jgi:DNA polymerase-3 subunit delta'
MSEEQTPPDQIAGAPHPRDTETLIGQGMAESEFLDAFRSGRLHHAWLLHGPRGVGKATCAYRIARFLLATPPAADDGLFGSASAEKTLDIAAGHPIAARVRARAEPGLRVITRSENEQGRIRAEIVVDDIRRLAEFFRLSSPDDGHRVVIVDAADEMNRSASNALLKLLEEPPAATTILLVSHRPSGLLPTIRSRCRTLRFAPLGPRELQAALAQARVEAGADGTALAELGGGSVGAAIRLLNLGGLELYGELVALMDSMPRLDRPRALAVAEGLAQRGAEDRLDLFIDLLDVALVRLARSGALGEAPREATEGEARIFTRLAPDPLAAQLWAERATELSARLRHGRAVNLDPAALVLDTLIRLNDTARDTTSRAPA